MWKPSQYSLGRLCEIACSWRLERPHNFDLLCITPDHSLSLAWGQGFSSSPGAFYVLCSEERTLATSHLSLSEDTDLWDAGGQFCFFGPWSLEPWHFLWPQDHAWPLPALYLSAFPLAIESVLFPPQHRLVLTDNLPR